MPPRVGEFIQCVMYDGRKGYLRCTYLEPLPGRGYDTLCKQTLKVSDADRGRLPHLKKLLYVPGPVQNYQSVHVTPGKNLQEWHDDLIAGSYRTMPSMDTDYVAANFVTVDIEYEQWDGQAVKNCLDKFFVKTKAADTPKHFVCMR